MELVNESPFHLDDAHTKWGVDSYTLVEMLKHPLVEDGVNDGGKGGRGKVSMIILREQLYSCKPHAPKLA